MRVTNPSSTRARRWAVAGTVALSLTVAAAAVPQTAQAEALPANAALTSASVVSAASTVAGRPVTAAARTKSVAMYGVSRSGLPWHSGIWTGAGMSAANTKAAEKWAGRPYDFTLVYPSYGSWAEMNDSSWIVRSMSGWKGRLIVGLPLLPNNRAGQWSDVTSGKYDYVFRNIAKQLKAGGRGDAAIRVGLEANGNWFAWATTRATAAKYKAAFQRVVRVMNAESPALTFWFDLSSGYGLDGQKNRMDALNVLYPGDKYVDGISMDHYDFWELIAKSNAQWAKAIKPTKGPGLADAAAFARKHKKGFAVPEWGVYGTSFGGGDNAFFIQKMYQFFVANKDVLVFESYFNEPASYIKDSLFSPVQMPKAAAAYRKYF